MNKICSLLFVTFFVSSAGSLFAQQIKLSNNVTQALSVIDTAQIKADIKYLADDKLLGRMPGTPGYQMAG